MPTITNPQYLLDQAKRRVTTSPILTLPGMGRVENRLLARDWPTLGPQLQGKLHLYVGSDDTYFLNDAVYLMEDFLKSTTNPPYDGEVAYGPRAEHCWNGDPTQPNYLSRLHYNTMYLPKILDQIQKTAPPGADLTSWRY